MTDDHSIATNLIRKAYLSTIIAYFPSKVTYSILHRRLNRYINNPMSSNQHLKPSYRFHVRVIGCLYTHKHLHTSCISPGLIDLIGYHFYCIWSSSICNPLYPHLTSSPCITPTVQHIGISTTDQS